MHTKETLMRKSLQSEIGKTDNDVEISRLRSALIEALVRKITTSQGPTASTVKVIAALDKVMSIDVEDFS